MSGAGRQVVLFNKPYDVLSQFRDQQGRTTLSNFIRDPSLRVAGRLDRDSEGLLVLTDSGALVNKITDPRQHMSKTYWVQVEGCPQPGDLAVFAEGILLRDGPCRAAKCHVMAAPEVWPRQPPIRSRRTIPTTWLSVTISQGRNRQVRRMCAAAGFPALRLIRYRVGSWTLDGLSPGHSRLLHLRQ